MRLEGAEASTGLSLLISRCIFSVTTVVIPLCIFASHSLTAIIFPVLHLNEVLTREERIVEFEADSDTQRRNVQRLSATLLLSSCHHHELGLGTNYRVLEVRLKDLCCNHQC